VISYRLFLAGDGSAWIDDVSVEVVEPDHHEED
jgi:hypothetical protein